MSTETIQEQPCSAALRPKAAATFLRTKLRSPHRFKLNTLQRHQRGAASA